MPRGRRQLHLVTTELRPAPTLPADVLGIIAVSLSPWDIVHFLATTYQYFYYTGRDNAIWRPLYQRDCIGHTPLVFPDGTVEYWLDYRHSYAFRVWARESPGGKPRVGSIFYSLEGLKPNGDGHWINYISVSMQGDQVRLRPTAKEPWVSTGETPQDILATQEPAPHYGISTRHYDKHPKHFILLEYIDPSNVTFHTYVQYPPQLRSILLTLRSSNPPY